MNNDENEIIELFLKLTSIDAESFNERKIVDAIIEELKVLGIEAHEDDAAYKLSGNAGNIYASLEGESDKDPVLLSSHLDTVVPGNGKKPVFENGIIKSDGKTVLGADDVAGIVEIISAIKRIIKSGKKHRKIELLFPVAEEVYTKGASVFDYSILESKEAYCLDLSGDVGSAVINAPTLISFEIIVKGKAAHAGFAPWEGINAIEAASKAIALIKQGKVDDDSTLNIGTINGGNATNIVSSECVIKGEIRSYIHDRALELYEDMIKIFKTEASAVGADVQGEYEIHIIAYKVDEKSNVVKRFIESCESIGLKPELRSSFGGSDSHQFNANGIKGIVLSCGMENVHTVNEYIKVENLIKGTDLVEQIILS